MSAVREEPEPGRPDFAAFERSAHERAQRARQREAAARGRAEKARAGAALATVDAVREGREREALAHERAARAQHDAVSFQNLHAEHSRRLAERSAGEADVGD